MKTTNANEMPTGGFVKEITFKCDKNGKKRAMYWSKSQFRWFPMPLAEAEMLVATGAAHFTPLHKVGFKPGMVRGW